MARSPVKTSLRAALRSARRAIAVERDTAADAAALAEHGLALVRGLGLGAGAVVTSYDAVAGEPPTTALNATLREHGIRVLLPITLTDLDLDWRELGDPDGTPLGPSAIGRADLVLAPGLAVDARGTRLGQGGGCYDKALPRRRAGTRVVVLLHPGELVGVGVDGEALPREAHDQPVDAVLTAEGTVEVGLTPGGRPPPA